MAFQGKGILGNISGKVGNIYGRVSNGKGIIQKCPKFPGRVPGWVYPVEFYTPINIAGCDVALGEASRNDTGNSVFKGVQSNYGWQSGKATFEWSVDIVDDLVWTVLDLDNQNNSPISIEWGVYFWTSAIRIYEGGSLAMEIPRVTAELGGRFIVDNGIVKFYLSQGGSNYQEVYQWSQEVPSGTFIYHKLIRPQDYVNELKLGGKSLVAHV